MKRPRSRPNDIRRPCNYECLMCGTVLKTPQGIMCHLSKYHGVRKDLIERGEHWRATMKTADTFVEAL